MSFVLHVGPNMLSHARYRIACDFVFLLLVLLPSLANSQTEPSPVMPVDQQTSTAHSLPLDQTLHRLSLSPWRAAEAQPVPRERDSLANGAIIGAVIGAAAMGGFGALLCKAFQEPEGPTCVSDTLRFAAIGAAIGAAGGVAVDAAVNRREVKASIRFSF